MPPAATRTADSSPAISARASDGIAIVPLAGFGEVAAGDDLAALICDALGGHVIRADDIVVVTSKIVSKAEARTIDLRAVMPGARAIELAAITGKDPRLVEAALGEAAGVVRAAPNVLITRHWLGLVMANSGIDQSNLGSGANDLALLLPEDPDGSATRLRDGIRRRLGVAPAVVLSDSFGRPWRMGVVNVAIGAAGMPALIDRRGEADRDGRVLAVTQVAAADLVASAAGLAMGEGAEGVPAVLVRGYRWAAADRPAAALVRRADEDLFR